MTIKEEIKSMSELVGTIGAGVKSYNDRIAQLTDTVSELQKKMLLQGGAGPTGVSAEVKSMMDYFSGKTSDAEYKATAANTGAVLNGPNGGYLAVEEYTRKVITKMVDDNPLIPEIDMYSISANIAGFPVEKDLPEANFVGEIDTVGDSKLSLAMANVPVKQMSVNIPMSRVLLNSSNVVDVEGYAIERTSKAIAHKMGKVILTGDGVNQPQGILNSKDLKTVKSGAAMSVTVDQLFAAAGAIPEEASANAKWYMSRQTFFTLAGVFGKDSSYINMGLGESMPRSIFGYPVVLCGDMPAFASGSKSILFGDMKAAYKGVQSGPLEFLRDPYSSSAQNVVNLRYWANFGGALVQPEAIIGIKTGA